MGRIIKHPSMIKTYTMPNYNCTTETPLEFIGLDFETDSLTGEIMVMGVFYKSYFNYFKDEHDLLDVLCKWIKIASEKNLIIVHWTKFDQNAIAKLFLLKMNKKDRAKSIERYGKYNATWGSDDWASPPLCSYKTKIKNKSYEFGIVSVLAQKTLNVFIRSEKMLRPIFINIIDMNSLYKTNLEKASLNQELNYYSKMKEGFKYKKKTYSYHVVDWNLFRTNEDYKKGVLRSNELDARAVKDLAYKFSENFYKIWKVYPKNIFSSGSLAKMALSKELNKDDFESLNLMKQFKNWNYEKDQETKNLCDELHILACESYSGGMFELYSIGMGSAYIADVSACYPSAISKLLDLRDSEIVKGYGSPPDPKDNEIIFIRGTVDMPKSAIHSLNIHNPDYINVITRPYGKFKASYIWHERKLALEQGAKFFNEEYIIIKTKGKKSPLAVASDKLFKMRQDLLSKKDVKQSIVKDANNSCYGITIEGVSTYALDEDDNIVFDGLKAGALYNPILASIITAYCRIILCSAMILIRNNGGTLIQANTDSIHWHGKLEDLPRDFETVIGSCGWRENKTKGYFEKPTLIKEFISLSTGRYGGFDTAKNKYFTKLRSYIIDQDPNKHYLKELLEKHKEDKICQTIPLASNQFISIKLSEARTNLDLIDVCRIDNVVKDIRLIAVNGKRLSALADLKNPIKKILSGFNDTVAYDSAMFVKDHEKGIKELRDLTVMRSRNIKSRGEIRREQFKRYNQDPVRKEKDKMRQRYNKKNLSKEKKEIIRKKDRERKRRN